MVIPQFLLLYLHNGVKTKVGPRDDDFLSAITIRVRRRSVDLSLR
jgi:hypothetical protein